MFCTLLATGGWAHEFTAFSRYHGIVLGCCAAAIVIACAAGLLLKRHGVDKAMRLTWGWLILAYKLAETIHDCWPGRFNVKDSIPLQICDLAAFVAAGAMITQARLFRTVLYFWGLGLSPQAVFMPTLSAGYASADFWFFWVSHTMVIGSAFYDIVVNRYRPGVKDLGIACAMSLAYLAVALLVDTTFGVNYGFVGSVKEGLPVAIERLGPWPFRVVKLSTSVGAVLVLVWAIWPVARRLSGSGRRNRSTSPSSVS